MKLKDIIENIGVLGTSGTLELEAAAICSDSRKVVPGAVFFAVKGFESDGHAYIAQALERGAAAVVFESGDAADYQGLSTTPRRKPAATSTSTNSNCFN